VNSSPDIIREIKSGMLRWAEHIPCMAEMINVYHILVGMPEGNRTL
jgi:hypothetical protein